MKVKASKLKGDHRVVWERVRVQRGRGAALPIHTLCAVTHLTVDVARRRIEDLREWGYPIVSAHGFPAGVFVAVSAVELNDAATTYERTARRLRDKATWLRSLYMRCACGCGEYIVPGGSHRADATYVDGSHRAIHHRRGNP